MLNADIIPDDTNQKLDLKYLINNRIKFLYNTCMSRVLIAWKSILLAVYCLQLELCNMPFRHAINQRMALITSIICTLLIYMINLYYRNKK